MSDSTLKEVYRVDVGSLLCRSAGALLMLNAQEIRGVDAVTIGDDGSLIVVADTQRDLFDDLVRAAVKTGLAPASVKAVDLERLIDPTPLTIEEARRAGLIAPHTEPARAVVETVQRMSVYVTDGYDPDTIIISAGVAAELEFSEGHGCLGRVVFDELGIEADLEQGGAVVKLPPLEPGTYGFRCGMDMVHGVLIAE